MSGRRSGGVVRLLHVLVLALVMALLDGEPFAWPELSADLASLPLLFALYLLYALTVRGGVATWRWSPRTTMLFGALVGVFLEGYFHRTLTADAPRLLGVNPLTLALMVVYWAVLTSAIAWYAAGRLLPAVRLHPYATGTWAALALGWTALLGVWAANLPPMHGAGYVTVTFILVALAAALIVQLKRAPGGSWPARSLALDVAAGLYVAAELAAVPLGLPRDVRIGLWALGGLVLGAVGVATLGTVENHRSS